MLADWNLLSDELQLTLSREALRQAVEIVADHAESLAREIEEGGIADHGGAEALRMLAAIIMATRPAPLKTAGQA